MTCDRWWRWTHKWGPWKSGKQLKEFASTQDFKDGLPSRTGRWWFRVCERCGIPQNKILKDSGYTTEEEAGNG